jgi:acetyltransferase-like isoleucine patch superfamily enzyme
MFAARFAAGGLGTLPGNLRLACQVEPVEIFGGLSAQGRVDSRMNPLPLLLRGCGGVASRWQNVWFRALGVRLGGYVWMRKISIPRQWSDITIEKGVGLDDGVILLCSGTAKNDKILLKSGTYINRHTMLDAHAHLEVGRDCLIGPFCYLTDSDHETAPIIAMGPQPMLTKATILEDNVWLGAGVIVLKGVRVGRNAVVGAGAVVTRDVPPGASVVGVPARAISRGAQIR